MKYLKRIILLLLLLTTVLLLCRCCTPRYNTRLTEPPSKRDTVHYPIPNDSQTIEFVCFSGGGTRAMAMGFYVVQNLMRVQYKQYTKDSILKWSTLRDEIDMTSGVSGGSFVSAALGMYPPEQWNDFYTKGVYCNIQKQIVLRLLLPWNWFKLASPYYTRTDIAAKYYNDYIFKQKNFNQLYDKPIVYINATLLAEGAHFVFNEQYFKYINSDINTYPVGFACAASSAFPGGFAPITVKNYTPSGITDSTMLKDPKYANAVRNSSRDIYQYEFAKMYRFLHDSTNEWIHLSDGGIAGNTGIERVLDEWKTNGIINKALNNSDNPLKRLIIIVMNAGTETDDKSCVQQSPPGIAKVLLYTTTTAMDILSRERYEVLKSKIDELWQTIQQTRSTDPSLALLEKPYLIEINARNIKDPVMKQKFDVIPTTFNLPTEQLETIHKVTFDLMNENAEFLRLKQAIAQDTLNIKQ